MRIVFSTLKKTIQLEVFRNFLPVGGLLVCNGNSGNILIPWNQIQKSIRIQNFNGFRSLFLIK